jgi:hypothetical protein
MQMKRRWHLTTILFVLFLCCCPLAQPQTCTPAPSGIVGWWPGDGNANDIIGGNNGTLVGTVSFVPGEVGQAFGFDLSGAVEIPPKADLDPQQVSVAAWVSAPSPAFYSYVLSNGPTGGSANYALYTGGAGGLYFYAYTTGGVVLSPDGGSSLWDGSLHYVVGTFDGSNIRLYVDGQEVGNGNSATGPLSYPSSQPVLIGSWDGSSYYWSGVIDEVQIFDQALTSAEIQATYNAATAGDCKGLTYSPASLKFPRQAVGTTSPSRTVTATNAFPLPVTVTSVKTSGDFAQTNACSTLAPGATCAVNVTFTPTAPGTQKGKLTVADSAPDTPQTISLKGAATDIELSVTRLNLGSHAVGTTSKAKSVTATNVGSVVVNFTGSGIALAGTDPGDFIISANTCGPSLGIGANCKVSIEFMPTATGTRSATLEFNDDGGSSPQTVALTGNGT